MKKSEEVRTAPSMEESKPSKEKEIEGWNAPKESAAAPLTGTEPYTEVLARAASACLLRAEAHDDRAKYFFSVGLLVAILGVLCYILFLVTASIGVTPFRPPDGDVGIARIHAMIDAEVALKFREGGDAETISKLQEAQHALQKSAEILKGENDRSERLVDRYLAFSWQRDGVPAVRNTVAFLFIEVVAGFLLALYQRHDIQASLWRSHRQVYERLLAAPGLAKALADAGTPITAEFVTELIAATPVTIYRGSKDANPSLALLQYLKDMTVPKAGAG